jgi:hypothetical protein
LFSVWPRGQLVGNRLLFSTVVRGVARAVDEGVSLQFGIRFVSLLMLLFFPC